MAPPPAKRQKRHIVLSSDDDVPTPPSKPSIAPHIKLKDSSKSANGGSVRNCSLPTRSRTTEESTLPPQLSRHSSPGKPQTKSTSKSLVDGSLHSFFNAASQAALAREKPRSDEQTPVVEETEEDIIEDDSGDEPIHKVSIRPGITGSTTRTVLDRRKPLREKPQNHILAPGQEKAITATQRFLTVGQASAKEASTQTKVVKEAPDTRPWSEKYGPASLEELMVHKRKVADVRGWLDGVLKGQDHKVSIRRIPMIGLLLTARKRLLILKGPSGAGKTATISALAKIMDVDVSEWKNPVDTDFTSENYISISAQFEDFLGRSGMFGSLNFSSDRPQIGASLQRDSTSMSDSNRKKLILIEEYPNTFTSTSQALRSFRTSILQYLASNVPFTDSFQPSQHQTTSNIRPLVMIITEISGSTSSDNFTAHRLLGPDILSHAGTSVIEFNPVAPTLLTKALEMVLQKEARHSGRRRIPGPSALKQLAEIGDVRSAISSLEFLCLRSSDSDDWSGRIAAKPKRGASNALTKMEKESLALVSQRESTLGLFHAVGKVVYNKREDPHPSQQPLPQPPLHLSPQHARHKVSEVDVEKLLDETGTDPLTFIAALHENYVRSCEGSSFIDTLNDSIDALSDADLLSSENARGRRIWHSHQASEDLRQTEIAFHVAVRGLLFALPYPVKRAAASTTTTATRHHNSNPSKGGLREGGGNRMRYPSSLRLGRQMEEMESLISTHFSTRSPDPFFSASASSSSVSAPAAEEGEKLRPLALQELLLDRMPYMVKVARHIPPSKKSVLEKITTFNLSSFSPSFLSEEEEEDPLPSSSQKIMPPPPPPPSSRLRGPDESVLEKEKGEGGKLWLSDDDIED
ncbi:MAG: hypothetical protein Q9191_003861 [Dirinaria sp. TL-2023a]